MDTTPNLDPEVLAMLAAGRRAIQADALKAKQAERDATAKADAAWAEHSAKLFEAIPEPLRQYATVDRGGYGMPNQNVIYNVDVQVPGFSEIGVKVKPDGTLDVIRADDYTHRIDPGDDEAFQWANSWEQALAIAAPAVQAPAAPATLGAEIHALMAAYFQRDPRLLYVGLDMHQAPGINNDQPYLNAGMQAESDYIKDTRVVGYSHRALTLGLKFDQNDAVATLEAAWDSLEANRATEAELHANTIPAVLAADTDDSQGDSGNNSDNDAILIGLAENAETASD